MSTVSRAPRAPQFPERSAHVGMLPEFIGNGVEVVNSFSRIALKTTLALETLVDDATDIVQIMGATQKARLLAEMAKQGYDLPAHLLPAK